MSAFAAAACRGQTDLMYATDDVGIEAAKHLCAGCPMRLPCLRDALEKNEPEGVWGGLDQFEREALRRRRRRQGANPVRISAVDIGALLQRSFQAKSAL